MEENMEVDSCDLCGEDGELEKVGEYYVCYRCKEDVENEN